MNITNITTKQITQPDTIKINNDFTIRVNTYLQRGDEPRVFYIQKITDKSRDKSSPKLYASYKIYNLETFVEYGVEDLNEFQIKEKFEKAAEISKSKFKALQKAAAQPVPEKDQEEMLRQIRKLIKEDALLPAQLELTDYFRKVVLRQPEKLRVYFEMRAAIPIAKFRPCICVEDYEKEVLENFYAKLNQNIWNLIPDKLKANPRKLTLRSDYKADPEDKQLEQLIRPFVSTDHMRKAMHGVYFDENGIVATDAHLLLFMPGKKPDKKGIYCMTRKCFKDNDGNSIVDAIYPKYREVLPKAKMKYKSYVLDISQMRKIIQTLKNNGFQKQKELAITFIYGDDEFIRFNTHKKLIPALETFAKLGHDKVKLWIYNNTSAGVFTAPDVSRKTLNEHGTDIVLVMPLYIGDTWEDIQDNMLLGDLIYNLDEHSISFKGSDAEAVYFENEDDKTVRIKLAKAKAIAQKQRIRILEMERIAA